MSARTHPRHHAPDAAGGHTGARSGGGGPSAVTPLPRAAATGSRTGASLPRGSAAGPGAVATLPRGAAAGPGAGGTGLRWWAVVLPVIAFSVLFLLVTGTGQAAASPSPVAFLGWIQPALTGF
ncbi:hypothetical protein E3E14_07765 [Streptomyces sp. ICN441]|uniref:hypothetical protein n=1 Tax=Streptomyces sp. ICN441 TaxID=2558286 RepID=UPI001069B397|nr:hypothetical protein [Streptomyces sp. ICN441]TFE54420.1 hypothetical protein E3E14_07765 [Streptomyces sp. ICN441]